MQKDKTKSWRSFDGIHGFELTCLNELSAAMPIAEMISEVHHRRNMAGGDERGATIVYQDRVSHRVMMLEASISREPYCYLSERL